MSLSLLLPFVLLFAQGEKGFEKEWRAAPSFEGSPFEGQHPLLEPLVAFGQMGKDPVVVLRNRGMIVTREKYTKGFSLEFEWMWVHGREEQGLLDGLCVAFHTKGEQRTWGAEIKEGVVARLWAPGKKIALEQFRALEEASVSLGERGGTDFARFVWHKVSLTVKADGNIELHVGGQILTAKVGDREQGADYIAIYNREAVHGVPKESVLRNIVIKPLE